MELDVAIIGGGAAGVAAGRRLSEHGRSVLLIEALPRLGGRAHTEIVEGLPLDFGCGWLHSAERNPLRALAESMGVEVSRSPSAWGSQFCNLGFSPDEQGAAWDAYDALNERLRDDPPPSDSAGDAIGRDHPWRAYIDGVSSFINGTELATLSARDVSAYNTVSSDKNWRLPHGYGEFIAGLGEKLPKALGTRVQAIFEDGSTRIETDRGVIEAKTAVVTVSSNVLASGTIRLGVQATDHLHAAASLPLGLANKVYFAMAESDLVPAESHLLGSPYRTATASHYLRPLGRPVVESYLGGEHARELEHAGPDAAASSAREELRRLLGQRFADSLRPIAVTAWGREPTVLGSYSHALPGAADARAVLAAPVSERLVFAGEACSKADFSTAHGAWESGLAAANWINQGL